DRNGLSTSQIRSAADVEVAAKPAHRAAAQAVASARRRIRPSPDPIPRYNSPRWREAARKHYPTLNSRGRAPVVASYPFERHRERASTETPLGGPREHPRARV